MTAKKKTTKKIAAKTAATTTPEPKREEHIVSTLVRVKLTIGGNGTGRVRANELAKEVATIHAMDAGSMLAQVAWMPKEYKSLLGAASSALRTGFNSRTLPWEDGGYRVVPADRYSDLQTFVAEFRATFDEAVAKIGAHWDEIIADARKRLNGAFDKLTLPTRDAFVASFSVDMDSSCVVAPQDIRVVGLDEVALTRIREQSAKEYGARIESGIGQLVEQMSELLSDLISRTEKPEQKGIRYDGWSKWAKKTIAAVRPLNITKNRALDSLMAHVESIASKLDPKAMRDSADARAIIATMAKRAAATTDALDGFGT
jgi:F0F1-type ATP synthase membrane subunit b/b'